MRTPSHAVALLLACAACEGSRPPAQDAHDVPLPPNETRTSVAVIMDLPQSSDCEERFDLALYAETGVELIDWAADVLSCSNKHATIRFLPARVSRASLETRVRQLALSATFSP